MWDKILSFLSLWITKFIDWRKVRRARFKTLSWQKKTANVFITSFVLFLLLLLLIDINFLWLFGKSPSLKAISNPNQNAASVIISSDGVEIGKYFSENRTPVEFNEISPKMIETLISTEDERFYQHFGIDLQGLFAAAKDMMHGNPRGASTITQQLVKNMYKTRDQYSRGLFGHIPVVKLLIMKAKEWITAVKIELFFTKEEILTKYLNTVDFGSNSFGIYTASKTFFNTVPAELNYEQSAVLVGLLKATTAYSPIKNPKRAKERRNTVLQNLANQAILTQQESDSLKKLPITLNFKVEENYDGQALHFRSYLAKYLEDWEKENGFDIYSDGLKIVVTIDSRLQQLAEDAVMEHMQRVQRRFFEHWRGQAPWQDEKHQEIPDFIDNIARKTEHYALLDRKFKGHKDSIDYYLNLPHKVKVFDYKAGIKDTTLSTIDSIKYMNHFLHTGFVAMEPSNGEVRAWVGDINFRMWQYDKVAQSKRQPGSTFKLFVYTTAMLNGMSPCDRKTDGYVQWDYMEKGQPKTWIPANVDYVYRGNVTLKYAFARSMNTVAVQLAKEFGIEKVIETAHKLGIKTELENMPSTSLGASDVSLLELVNSYATIVYEGTRNEPILVSRIEDSKGKVVYEAPKLKVQAVPYETAFLMTEMLKGGMTEPGGTSQALWEWDLFRYDTDFGGKTGTSSNHSDAWYVGVSKNLVAGAWVGGEHRSIHFRTGELGQGSRLALPIYGLFMEKLLKDEQFKKYRGKFAGKPKQKIERSYNCHTVLPKDTTKSESDSLASETPIESL